MSCPHLWHEVAETEFGNVPMQQIDSAVVLQCLQPIMAKTPETGTRLRGRNALREMMEKWVIGTSLTMAPQNWAT